MIQFEDLKFYPCLNNNLLCTLELPNGYSLDIIKKISTRTYKIKPFDAIEGKKTYTPNLFQEYGEYPEFNSRVLLMVFINEISRHDLSEEPRDLEEDIEEDYD